MTQVGEISSHVDLGALFKDFPLSESIPYLKYGDKERGEPNTKKKVKKKVDDKRKHYFFNQVTLHVNVGKVINLKVFNNGGIQMTGLKGESQGSTAIENVLQRVSTLGPEAISAIFYTIKVLPTCLRLKMVMINSDFDIGFTIDREKLHRAMVSYRYYSSFESTIYPGVNIKYYYNPGKHSDGICNCEGVCDGKGANGLCKKITIAVFKSGKIIITGGSSMEHINTAYDFITKFAESHKSDIIAPR
tara:strand:+ start:310 stop:1047 length:738 start_codon:yes stop_codon:yes gene_type:complete